MSEIEAFTIAFQPSLDPEDLKYISHKTNSTQLQNEASFMYLFAKIHKQPMKTRAIISYAGSLCHGISKCLDVYLKRIVKHMPYIATSSASVVKKITSKNWPPNCKIFTCDTVSMYTNIHLKHALPIIRDFLTNTELGRMIVDTEHINISALLAALDLVMNNNVFRFGDTYFLQKHGTAMGTPPAPTYATLYFAIWEHYVIPSFPELQLYFGYIDDSSASGTLLIQKRTMKDGHSSNNEWTILVMIICSFVLTLNFYHSRGNLVRELLLKSSLTSLLLVHPVVQFLQPCTKNH